MNAIAEQSYIQTELKKFTVTDAGIAEMEKKYSHLSIKGVEDKQGYLAVREARLDVKCKRVEVEKKRKELTDDALKFKRAIDSEAKRITGLLEPIESRLSAEEQAYEEEKERIKKEKELQEHLRLQNRINQLMQIGFVFDGEAYRATFTDPATGLSSTGFYKLESLKNDSDERFNEALTSATADYEAHQIAKSLIERQKLAEVARAEEERHAQEQLIENMRKEQEAERERLEAVAREQTEREAAIKAAQEKLEADKRDMEEAKQREAEAKVREAQLEQARQEAAEKALQEERERIERERLKKIEEQEKAAAELARQEALKPDKEKLLEMANHISSLLWPNFKNKGTEKISITAKNMLNEVAVYIELETEKL